jgi:hypothetical protein
MSEQIDLPIEEDAADRGRSASWSRLRLCIEFTVLFVIAWILAHAILPETGGP